MSLTAAALSAKRARKNALRAARRKRRMRAAVVPRRLAVQNALAKIAGRLRP